MTKKQYDRNIRELEQRLKTTKEDYLAMVLRNCITTMKMKHKEARRAERNANREAKNDG